MTRDPYRNPYTSVEGPPDIDVDHEQDRIRRLLREMSQKRNARKRNAYIDAIQDSVYRLDAVGADVPDGVEGLGIFRTIEAVV